MEEERAIEISRPMGERIENGALRYDPVFHPPMCVMEETWYECEGCGVCGEEREAGERRSPLREPDVCELGKGEEE